MARKKDGYRVVSINPNDIETYTELVLKEGWEPWGLPLLGNDGKVFQAYMHFKENNQ